jgi:hypothetical protein
MASSGRWFKKTLGVYALRRRASICPLRVTSAYQIAPTGAICLRTGTRSTDMERGAVSKVLRLAKVTEDERRVLNLAPVVGKFRTPVLDPALSTPALSDLKRPRRALPNDGRDVPMRV